MSDVNENTVLFRNRFGEPITLSSALFSKEHIAHSLIFAQTGSGMSALIDYRALHDMAMSNPRIFIIEKGDSFDLLAKHFKENNNE